MTGEIIPRSKSPTRKFLIYGFPNVSTALVMGFADFALFTLYNLGYQIDPIIVGIVLAIGKLTIAASQFFFGWISDYKYTRWGRRKPYIFILSPLVGISFLFLLMPTLVISFSDKMALIMWFLLWNVLFNIGYGVTSPYGSWMVEQFSVKERPKASQYINIFSFIGTATMSVFSLLVLTNFIGQVTISPQYIPPVFFISVLIFSVLPILFFYFSGFLIKTEPKFTIQSNIVHNLRVLLSNKNFLLVTLMQGIASVGFIMVGQTLLQYTEVVLKFHDFDYYIVAGLMIFGIFGFIVIWRKLIERIGKKRSLLYTFLVAILFLPTSLIGAIPMGSYLIFGILFVLGLAACLGGWFLYSSIIYADLAEDDQKSTGELKAGIYTGFPSITLNIFQSCGLLLLGIILDLPKMGLDYSIGYVIWGPIGSLILIGAYLYSRKFIQLDFEWENVIK
jgi:GPH family glycoside/pentoside/hexuronide:cation symporter